MNPLCSCFRYLYFLQLKSDIIEGILPCSPEQAVALASYAVQGIMHVYLKKFDVFVILYKFIKIFFKFIFEHMIIINMYNIYNVLFIWQAYQLVLTPAKILY